MSQNTIGTIPEVSYPLEDIRTKIYVIRGVQVMLDSDLAQLYQVETRVLNQSVKRNQSRFPTEFCFQLVKEEFENLKSQFVTSRGKTEWGGVRKMPYVFTEHGVAMLSAVLRSEKAVKISIAIIRAFVSMRHFLVDNGMVFQRLDRIELKQMEADEKFRQIFSQLDAPKQDKAIIFFKGQMWDAVNCIEEIIFRAEKSIILIDGYVDRNTLAMLAGKKAFEISINEDEKLLDAILKRL